MGFTLAELLVATAVMGLLLTTVCGIYFSTASEWERQQGEACALIATSQTCTRLSDYISQATGATVVNRFGTGDALAVNLPIDTAYGGVSIPVWSGGTLQYRSGSWIIFYLSDTTGSYMRKGNILWSGSMSWVGFPLSVTPDVSWSLYYNTGKGRITPLDSLSFAVNNSGTRPTITVTAVSSYKIKGTQKQISQSRTVCLRNTN